MKYMKESLDFYKGKSSKWLHFNISLVSDTFGVDDIILIVPV